MNEQTEDDQKNQQNSRERLFRSVFTYAIIIFLLCPVFYCAVVPATTGQLCIDFLSGHVPRKADEIYLDALVNAMVEQDFESLSETMKSSVLLQLKDLAPLATRDYKVIFRDDLSGVYERGIEFSNGVAVSLSFHGTWSCPDFIVTEREVFERIELLKIRIYELE